MTVVTTHSILEGSDSLANSINVTKVVWYVNLFITALEQTSAEKNKTKLESKYMNSIISFGI